MTEPNQIVESRRGNRVGILTPKAFVPGESGMAHHPIKRGAVLYGFEVPANVRVDAVSIAQDREIRLEPGQSWEEALGNTGAPLPGPYLMVLLTNVGEITTALQLDVYLEEPAVAAGARAAQGAPPYQTQPAPFPTFNAPNPVAAAMGGGVSRTIGGTDTSGVSRTVNVRKRHQSSISSNGVATVAVTKRHVAFRKTDQPAPDRKTQVRSQLNAQPRYHAVEEGANLPEGVSPPPPRTNALAQNMMYQARQGRIPFVVDIDGKVITQTPNAQVAAAPVANQNVDLTLVLPNEGEKAINLLPGIAIALLEFVEKETYAPIRQAFLPSITRGFDEAMVREGTATVGDPQNQTYDVVVILPEILLKRLSGVVRRTQAGLHPTERTAISNAFRKGLNLEPLEVPFEVPAVMAANPNHQEPQQQQQTFPAAYETVG